MTFPDPNTCRRALREIGEIAAVAVLPDSQMTDQEALGTIAAIARWVDEERAGDRPGCGDVIRRLNAMTAATDFEAMTDGEALQLFDDVLGVLRASADPEAGVAGAISAEHEV